MKKVLIIGYTGFDNFGDEALLHVAIEDLIKVGYQREFITATSDNPGLTEELHGVKSINRWSIFEMLGTLFSSSTVMFIGGLFQDKTSFKSFLYYFFILFTANTVGKSTVFYGAGIGPLTGKFTKSLFDIAVSGMKYFTVRDKTSATYIPYPNNVHITIDPAWSIKPDLSVHGKIKEINWDLPVLGVSMKYDKNLTAKHMRYFAEKLSKVVTDMKDWQVLFIPCMPNEDSQVTYELFQMVEQKTGGHAVHYIDYLNEYSLPEQVGIFTSCDVYFGMRYHSLLVPLSAGRPVIGLVTDPKIKSLMEYTNQVHFNLGDDLEQSWNYFWHNVKYSSELAEKARDEALELHQTNIEILRETINY